MAGKTSKKTQPKNLENTNIAKQKKYVDNIEQSQVNWTGYLENAPEGVYLSNLKGTFLYGNKKAEQIMGYKKEELIGRSFLNLNILPTVYLAKAAKLLALNLLGRSTGPDELELIRKDGKHVLVEINTAPVKEQGDVIVIGFVRDITERRHIEKLLNESETKYRALTENSLTGIYIHQDGIFVFVNNKFAEMHGYKPEELISREAILLNHPEDREVVKDRLFRISHGSIEWETGQNRRLKKDGTTIWCQIMVSVIDYKGKPAIMGNVIDITERKKMEEELKSLATHDALTGLPNRRLLNDRFDIALANAQRKKKRLALMSLDLDKFKAINDTFGHDVGDKLLVAAAGRLTGVLRKVDTVARIGGDEFILLLWDVDQKGDSIKVAQKVVEEFRQPFVINGKKLNITVSVGVAIYPEDGQDIADLLKNSDKSLYRAKESGRDRYQAAANDDS